MICDRCSYAHVIRRCSDGDDLFCENNDPRIRTYIKMLDDTDSCPCFEPKGVDE